MAITLTGITSLQSYLMGVMDRADHHAHKVNEIVLALIGGVVWISTNNIKVRESKGVTANVLWFEVNGKTYCFSFNHDTGDIDVKENSIKGTVLRSFNNSTHISDVKLFFESFNKRFNMYI